MTPVIIGEFVEGESHKRHNIECQDSFLIIDGVHKNRHKSRYYEDLDEDVKIIAVADGHGSKSCPHSKTGSQTAVNVFCDIMAEYLVKYKEDRDGLFATLNSEGEATGIAKSIVSEWERRILEVHKLNRRERMYDAAGNPDHAAVWKQYGSTLLGLLITKDFIFAMQLGDGDITYVDKNGVLPFIEGDKLLGVETHSISKEDSWKKFFTKAVRINNIKENRFLYILSTDGWLNSHASEEEFHKTCQEYFSLCRKHGLTVIENNLKKWLSETSAMGCGDDITVVFAYFERK